MKNKLSVICEAYDKHRTILSEADEWEDPTRFATNPEELNAAAFNAGIAVPQNSSQWADYIKQHPGKASKELAITLGKAGKDAAVAAGKKAYGAGKKLVLGDEDAERAKLQDMEDATRANKRELIAMQRDLKDQAAHGDSAAEAEADGLDNMINDAYNKEKALQNKRIDLHKYRTTGAQIGSITGGALGAGAGAWAGKRFLLGKGEVRAAVKDAIISSSSPSQAISKLSSLNSKKALAYAEVIKKNAGSPNWKSKTLRKMALNSALAVGGGGLVGGALGAAGGARAGAELGQAALMHRTEPDYAGAFGS